MIRDRGAHGPTGAAHIGRIVARWLAPAVAILAMAIADAAGSSDAGSFNRASGNKAPSLPTNVCYDDRCGPLQKTIWKRFQSGRGLDPGGIASLYSGTCFALSEQMKRDRQHWGGFLIDGEAGRLWFDGRFSFFDEFPDYVRWTVVDARREWPVRWEVRANDGYAYGDASLNRQPFRYWFRRAADSSDLLLVSYFGFQMTMLCDLRRHR